MPEFRGVVLDDTGTAINGATVELYDVDTTTPVRATTTTDSSGLWSISHSTRGRFDRKITNGSDVVWLRARDRFQVDVLQAESPDSTPLVATYTEDAASVQVAILEGDRATPADNDAAYVTLRLSDSAGNQDEQARISWSATTVANGATQDGDLILSALTNGSLTEYLRVDGSAGGVNIPTVLFVNDDANANMTVGLSINQGSNDNQILALKSSDIATGLSTALGIQNVETDDFLSVGKINATLGGVLVQALAEDGATTRSFQVQAAGGTADTTKTTSGIGLADFTIYEHDGANSLANITANGNVLSVRAQVGGSVVARMLVDEDGDLFAVNTTITGLDNEDDVGLIRAFEKTRTAEGIIESEWDAYVSANEDDLVRVGVLGAPVKDGGMWNITQHMRLMNGAVWQLATRVFELEKDMAALPEARS